MYPRPHRHAPQPILRRATVEHFAMAVREMHLAASVRVETMAADKRSRADRDADPEIMTTSQTAILQFLRAVG
jgi:hypothetical protein